MNAVTGEICKCASSMMDCSQCECMSLQTGGSRKKPLLFDPEKWSPKAHSCSFVATDEKSCCVAQVVQNPSLNNKMGPDFLWVYAFKGGFFFLVASSMPKNISLVWVPLESCSV